MIRKQLCLLVLAAPFLSAPLVQADVQFEKAVPSPDSTQSWPPSAIQVWFTQPLDHNGSTLALRGPSGALTLSGFHVMDGRSLMASVGDRMPDGVYTIAWEARGTDGSSRKGEYNFTVKRVK